MTDPEASPLFVVGSGRSGTTVLYELLARHHDTAWFSTWTDRSRRAELAVFNRLFKRDWHSRRYGPRPAEGTRLWPAALALPASLALGRLQEEHATNDTAQRVRSIIERHSRFSGAPVFVNKNTRNTYRLRFLRAIYPHARFVHVIRSPLDTISSLLNVRWWGDLPLWWHQGVTPRQLCSDPVDEARVAAMHWTNGVRTALDDSRGLSPDQYVEVRYEDLVASPRDFTSDLFEVLGLDWPGYPVSAFERRASRGSVDAYRRRLSEDQIRVAWTTVEETASALGYSLS